MRLRTSFVIRGIAAAWCLWCGASNKSCGRYATCKAKAMRTNHAFPSLSLVVPGLLILCSLAVTGCNKASDADNAPPPKPTTDATTPGGTPTDSATNAPTTPTTTTPASDSSNTTTTAPAATATVPSDSSKSSNDTNAANATPQTQASPSQDSKAH